MPLAPAIIAPQQSQSDAASGRRVTKPFFGSVEKMLAPTAQIAPLQRRERRRVMTPRHQATFVESARRISHVPWRRVTLSFSPWRASLSLYETRYILEGGLVQNGVAHSSHGIRSREAR